MIISCVNYKGGVGKSTLTQNLAVALAHRGYKICIVDADVTAATMDWAEMRHENEIEPSQGCVHEPLKCLGCVLQTKWHAQKLKQTERRNYGSFANMIRVHRHLVISFD